MFDPLDMFCGGPVSAEGLMMVEEEEERRNKIEQIGDYLKMCVNLSLRDACKAYKIPYNSITKIEKAIIKTKAPWIC